MTGLIYLLISFIKLALINFKWYVVNDCIVSRHVDPILLSSKKNRSFYRSSHWRCSVRKVVLRNFAKFTGKHLCQSLLFNNVPGPCNFIKKETLAQVFSCEFCEISKNTFFTEHIWATASVFKSQRSTFVSVV